MKASVMKLWLPIMVPLVALSVWCCLACGGARADWDTRVRSTAVLCSNSDSAADPRRLYSERSRSTLSLTTRRFAAHIHLASHANFWRNAGATPTRTHAKARSVASSSFSLLAVLLAPRKSGRMDDPGIPRPTLAGRRFPAGGRPMPPMGTGIAGAPLDDKIYVFGGESGQGTFDENEAYDPGTNIWQAMPSLPTARHGLAAVAVGGRIYVLAGGTTPGGSRSALNEVFISLKAATT